MKHKATFFDDDGRPERFTVDMTLREMALLYAFVGNVSPKAVTDASDIEWGNTVYDLAEGVAGIGNTYFDAGWAEVAPNLRPITLRAASERNNP